MNSKFRGTLLGTLIGDGCGAAFEGEILDSGARLVLKNFLKKLEGEYFTAPCLKFTDDTAMTKSVARCLIDYDEKNYQKNLAINFVKEYFKEPHRSYGHGVIDVFHKLRQTKFEDVTLPGKQQYNGRGSFGSGAAMRISPVALYCLNKSNEFLIDMVQKTSEITHTNAIGINGAVIQAFAIHQNLKMDSNKELNVNHYIDELIERMSTVETGTDEFGIAGEKHYANQLNQMKKLLNKKFEPSNEEVVNTLGHSVNALYSVPTSIYCFLRNSQINDDTNNPFHRCLEYSISLGGDTDTIASMACSLVGSLFGDKLIAENLARHCEDSDEIKHLADAMYAIAVQN